VSDDCIWIGTDPFPRPRQPTPWRSRGISPLVRIVQSTSSTHGRSIFIQVLLQQPRTYHSLTTFSPSGKLAQIEYALAAVGQGLPSLGIRCSNGVVLASEKPYQSILSDQSSFEKISRLTPDAGVVYSGMGPDFRVLVDKARKAAHAVMSHYTMELTIELLENL
jgi:hypothetical protein